MDREIHVLRGFQHRAAVLFLGMAVALALPSSAAAAIVWAVGDGAGDTAGDDQVAAMVAADNPDAFLYLGDVYDSGTAEEFTSFYEPGFGRLKAKTYPTAGNHEWANRAAGYFPYWSFRLSGAEYYSFDVGGWHLVSLSSEGEHGAGSPQAQWLNADLAAHPGLCNIAYFHRPRFSAGSHGDQSDMEPIWQVLDGRAAIVLTGHDHNYQRIGPIGSATHFVVGSGGRSHYSLNPAYPGLSSYNTTDYGALRLELNPGQAQFQLRAVSGATIDSGTVMCTADRTDPGSGTDGPGTGGPGTDGPDGDNPALAITVKAPRRQGLRYALRRGVGLRIGCNESCTVRGSLKLRAKGGRKARKRYGRRLGSGKWHLRKAGKRFVRIRLSKRARSRLARRTRVRLSIRVVASNTSGDRAVDSKNTLIRRKRFAR